MIRKLDVDRENAGPRWPDCGAWDLDAFFGELRNAVLELEQAAAEGRLRGELAQPGLVEVIGPDLVATYRNLARRRLSEDAERHDKRREAVHALLAQLRDEAFVVRKWGVARGSLWQKKPSLETEVEGTEAVLQRLDQVAARRFWGIGFVHEEDVDASDELARHAVRRSVRRFARDLRDLADVLRRRTDAGVILVPNHEDRRFEQLMLDILDENHHRAEPARLAEDFCQKTDLRVRYPGLDRVRGARVQVKATKSPKIHEMRIADIRDRDTFVILSPVAIAGFIDDIVARRLPPLLDRAQLEAFWRSIPGEPTTIDELAPAIGRVLERALSRPNSDPRGPMALVPEALRAVVRCYVKHEAFRSTEALRRSEASGKVYRRRADGRLRRGDSAGSA
ncbi:MAG: hypothetical protein U1F36_18125 [Planctomycetota bacterium]